MDTMTCRWGLRTADKSRGFNLLEVVVAAFIFTVGVVLLVALWVAYAKGIQKSRNHIVASYLAEMKMEEVIDSGFSGVTAPSSSDVHMTVVARGISNEEVYTVAMTFDEFVPGKKKRVVVTVSWNEGSVVRKVEYETVLCKAG